jgi:hypothetical protein
MMNKFIQNYVKKEKKIIPVLKLASIYGMHHMTWSQASWRCAKGEGFFFII